MANDSSFTDQNGNKYSWNELGKPLQTIPSTAEMIYFILFVGSCYLGLTTLLFTTTNQGVKSLTILLITIANYALLIGLIYYLAKFVKALLKILTERR